MHPTQIPPLTFLKSYMGPNITFTVCDCTCIDNVTLHHLIQGDEKIREYRSCFSCQTSDIQYAGQLAHREQTGTGLNAEWHPEGDPLRAQYFIELWYFVVKAEVGKFWWECNKYHLKWNGQCAVCRCTEGTTTFTLCFLCKQYKATHNSRVKLWVWF